MTKKKEPDKFLIRTTRLVVVPPGEPIFAEGATQITIVDEAGGEFLEIAQDQDIGDRKQTIRVDPGEWLVLREAIGRMMGEIEKYARS